MTISEREDAVIIWGGAARILALLVVAYFALLELAYSEVEKRTKGEVSLNAVTATIPKASHDSGTERMMAGCR